MQLSLPKVYTFNTAGTKIISLRGSRFMASFLFLISCMGLAVTSQVFIVEVLGRLVLLGLKGPFYRSSQWIKNLRYLFRHRGSTVFVLFDSFRTMSGSLLNLLFRSSVNIHLSRTCTFPGVIRKISRQSTLFCNHFHKILKFIYADVLV